jgi:hypothetical protein
MTGLSPIEKDTELSLKKDLRVFSSTYNIVLKLNMITYYAAQN